MNLRAGRVLSRANENRLREAAAAILDVLAQVEGAGEENSRRGAPSAELRSYEMTGVEVRADGEQPVITGYAAVYNRRSVMLWDFQEEILTGAFASTLKRNPDVRALWQHDPAAVLGRTTNETLRVWEDDTGLGFELRPPATQVGRDAVELIRRGDVNQMSFGFTMVPEGQKWFTDESGLLVRQVVEVDNLMEVSPVTFPAYPDTTATLRSLLRNAPDWVQRALLPNGVDPSSTDDSMTARARLDLLRREIELLSI